MSNLNLPTHVKPAGDTKASNGALPAPTMHNEAADKLLTSKLALLAVINSSWNLAPASSPLPAGIAPQAPKELNPEHTSIAALLSRPSVNDIAQPPLETVLWTKNLLQQLRELSTRTKGDAGRVRAWEALERVVQDRRQGFTNVTGAGAVVRECLPADVRETMRILKRK